MTVPNLILMKRSLPVLFMLCSPCILYCLPLQSPREAIKGAEIEEILEHRILDIKVSGVLDTASWTVYKSSYSVQFEFPAVPDDQRLPKAPVTQVWLLKADGTVVATSGKPVYRGISMTGVIVPSIEYLFPRADSVAIVIRILRH